MLQSFCAYGALWLTKNAVAGISGLAAISVKKKIMGSQKQRKRCMKARQSTIEGTDSRS